ncbi:hypothetical protein AVEN_214951-1 [Araneus ventricosus]|uniref:Uncharacterized protein n=1 Tax=Araneus ventricosus TaxID=182803 RepID=A0A4Y2D8Z3_ARAVE|nr:hypothetical protein AVEN_214951-1 [Araneus ventricosus]
MVASKRPSLVNPFLKVGAHEIPILSLIFDPPLNYSASSSTSVYHPYPVLRSDGHFNSNLLVSPVIEIARMMLRKESQVLDLFDRRSVSFGQRSRWKLGRILLMLSEIPVYLSLVFWTSLFESRHLQAGVSRNGTSQDIMTMKLFTIDEFCGECGTEMKRRINEKCINGALMYLFDFFILLKS